MDILNINDIVGDVAALLSPLAWSDSISGLSKVGKKIKRVNEQTKEITFPVTYPTAAEQLNCSDFWKLIAPNSDKRSVVWFEQLTDSTPVQRGDIPKRPWEHTVTIRLLAWVNLPKMGWTQDKHFELINDVLTQIGRVTSKQLSNPGYVRWSYQRSPQRNETLFSRYNIFTDNPKLLYEPYDYFGIDFQLKFWTWSFCVVTTQTQAEICDTEVFQIEGNT